MTNLIEEKQKESWKICKAESKLVCKVESYKIESCKNYI